MDEQSLIEYVTRQRWYGAKSRTVSHSEVLDTVTIRQAESQLSLALVEMRFDTGAHDIYQLLVSGGGEGGGGPSDGLAEDAGLAREIVSAMRAGMTLQGSEGMAEFTPAEDFSALGRELGAARLVSSEQSNSSVVFDDALILKVFRRLEPGINPELEMLRFLTEQGFRNIPALGGWYGYSGGPLTATLGLLQEYVAGAIGGWELALGEIASAPESFLDRLGRLGEVTANMHTALGADPTDLAFAPEEPSVEALGLLTATAAELTRDADVPEDWEERARERFLESYLETIDATLLPPGEAAIDRLLAVFELEKAVYELRYELDNRPDWVGIPVAGIERLMHQAAEAL